jgi:hypothetical protein
MIPVLMPRWDGLIRGGLATAKPVHPGMGLRPRRTIMRLKSSLIISRELKSVEES